LSTWEDKSWIGVTGKIPLKALAASLKRRIAATTFKTTGSDGTPVKAGTTEARDLARQGATRVEPDQVNFEIPDDFKLEGAKLSTMTQAIVYMGIKEAKAKPFRKATDNNVKQVQAAMQQNFNRLPLPAEIWKSIRHKDFTRQTRNFLWKSIHGAHRIGEFWKHIPDCEQWGICQYCEETEDLEHILLKCKRPGQELIWKLTRDLWLRKHSRWPDLSLGNILGCGLASFCDNDGNFLPGTLRLYRILISESIFLIWKARNDIVIQGGGKPLSSAEIHNRWVFRINQCLGRDCTLSNQVRYDKQISVKPTLVLQTWRLTLQDEDKLPENWLRVPKILVGIGPLSPPSPLVSGRRGRNR
ncbi:hypothetical protein B0H19DRAFT_958216, partial [Mycena capillaripes]